MVRQWASKRMTSIVRLQACIRTMIARKKYRRQKIEVRTLAVHFSVKLMSVTHGKIALQFEKIQNLIKLCTYIFLLHTPLSLNTVESLNTFIFVFYFLCILWVSLTLEFQSAMNKKKLSFFIIYKLKFIYKILLKKWQ